MRQTIMIVCGLVLSLGVTACDSESIDESAFRNFTSAAHNARIEMQMQAERGEPQNTAQYFEAIVRICSNTDTNATTRKIFDAIIEGYSSLIPAARAYDRRLNQFVKAGMTEYTSFDSKADIIERLGMAQDAARAVQAYKTAHTELADVIESAMQGVDISAQTREEFMRGFNDARSRQMVIKALDCDLTIFQSSEELLQLMIDHVGHFKPNDFGTMVFEDDQAGRAFDRLQTKILNASESQIQILEEINRHAAQQNN